MAAACCRCGERRALIENLSAEPPPDSGVVQGRRFAAMHSYFSSL
jgi:hypothetical protein